MQAGVYKYIEQAYGDCIFSPMFYANSGGTVNVTIDHSIESADLILVHSIQWDNGANATVRFTDPFGQLLLQQSQITAGNIPSYLPYVFKGGKLKITASVVLSMFVVGYQWLIKEQIKR